MPEKRPFYSLPTCYTRNNSLIKCTRKRNFKKVCKTLGLPFDAYPNKQKVAKKKKSQTWAIMTENRTSVEKLEGGNQGLHFGPVIE